MKKGFTLIELLAVIVILAIIALIATPIILGIINDARKESNEKSAELYTSAVRNAIASYQLTHPNVPTTFDDLDIQYDGNVVCTTEELYADGSFYITDCTVNGDTVEYTYGEQQELPSTQISKPQYYSRAGYGELGGDLPSDAKTTVLELNPTKPFYLGIEVDANNKVTAVYACFVRNETEYCLKGGDNGEAFVKNTEIIKNAYADVLDSCVFNDSSSICSSDTFSLSASSNGEVFAPNGYESCDISSNGVFSCR